MFSTTLLLISIAKICRVAKYKYDRFEGWEYLHHYLEIVEKTRDGQMFPPLKCGRGDKIMKRISFLFVLGKILEKITTQMT